MILRYRILKKIKKSLWKIYHLINIKDSRYIKGKVLDTIKDVGIVRQITVGKLSDSSLSDVYRLSLDSIETKGTYLTYMLLTSKIETDTLYRLGTYGRNTLCKVESMFELLANNYTKVGHDATVIKKTELFNDIVYLAGYSGDPSDIIKSSKNLVYRKSFLENILINISEDRNYLTSVDKNIVDIREYGDVKLDAVLIWADKDHLSRYGCVNCRDINTTTISRPPDITESEDLKDIMDLYSKISMVLRDTLYILDSADTIIKYLASKIHNDEYRYVTKTITNFKY